MKLREFIVSIVAKYSGDGFARADKDIDGLKSTTKEATADLKALDKVLGQVVKQAAGLAALGRGVKQASSQIAAASRAQASSVGRSARTSIGASKRIEQQFFAAVAKTEKALDREDAARRRSATRAAAAAARKADAEQRYAERAATARRRASDRARAAEERNLARLRAQTRRSHQNIIALDLGLFKKRREQTAAAARESEAAAQRFRASASEQIGGIANVAAGVGRAIGVGVAGLVGIGAAVIKTGVSFESLRARLKTVEGSSEGAARAFALIQNFARTTPFEVDNLTEGFTALRVRGVQPTTKDLTALGDLSSAFGQNFTDITDAIGAAARGELDPIEKFGIAGKIAGDKIVLSFKDQKVEVERTASAVTAALVKFGQMEGVQGAMAEQSGTASGMLSNLADAVSGFLDTVAQLGVLDAFKGLLEDIGEKMGEGQGFAQVLADALVAIIEAVRSFIQGITAEDIGSLLDSIYDGAVAIASAVGAMVEAFQWFVAQSGDVGSALENLTLLAVGFALALTGPAGIVIAAGLVGAAIGRMAASGIEDLAAMRAEVEAIQGQIKQTDALLKNIKNSNAEFEANEAKRKERQQKIQEADVKKAFGGLGGGLLQQKGTAEQFALLEQARRGNEQERAAAEAGLFTTEGKVVYDAIRKQERTRLDQAEKRARVEAKKRGQDQDAAAQAARAAVLESNRSTRAKAFEAAQATFSATGSAEAAAKAGAAKIGVVKGAAKTGKGGKGEQFFEFEKEAKAAAKRQAETFAKQELERLIGEGVGSDEAIARARQAGRERAKELEERFKQAGKIFDASSKNILDILGLRGPGSVLENRPPPQTLLITIAPIIKLVETLNIDVSGGASEEQRDAMRDAANQARDEIMARLSDLPGLVQQMFALQGKSLLAAQGGGRTIEGVQ